MFETKYLLNDMYFYNCEIYEESHEYFNGISMTITYFVTIYINFAYDIDDPDYKYEDGVSYLLGTYTIKDVKKYDHEALEKYINRHFRKKDFYSVINTIFFKRERFFENMYRYINPS